MYNNKHNIDGAKLFSQLTTLRMELFNEINKSI